MKKQLLTAVAGLALVVGTVNSVNAATWQPPLPARTVKFYVVNLPQPFASNISFINATISQPSIQDSGSVLRLDGYSWDIGSPIGVIALGSQDKPWVYPIASGEISASMQFTSCSNGAKDVNPTPFDNLVNRLLIADWVARSNNTKIVVFTGDNESTNTGTGMSMTLTSTNIMSNAIVSFKAVRLPESTYNKMSTAYSCMSDLYDPVVGNLGGMLLGWKDVSPRGVALYNAQNYRQTLEVPPCTPGGSEWSNDLSGLTMLIRVDQLLDSPVHPWQQLTVQENDSQPFGNSFQVVWNQFVRSVFVPVAMKH